MIQRLRPFGRDEENRRAKGADRDPEGRREIFLYHVPPGSGRNGLCETNLRELLAGVGGEVGAPTVTG